MTVSWSTHVTFKSKLFLNNISSQNAYVTCDICDMCASEILYHVYVAMTVGGTAMISILRSGSVHHQYLQFDAKPGQRKNRFQKLG